MRKKAKFRVGQVVCVRGIAALQDPDLFGIVKGFDDGRWHVAVAGRTLKCITSVLRPLTMRERGERHGK